MNTLDPSRFPPRSAVAAALRSPPQRARSALPALLRRWYGHLAPMALLK